MPNETAQRFLESLEVASPCHVDWDEMTGDEQARFCLHCEKNVYNISEMSRAEAEQFMRQQEGPICIRMYRRHDGTVINDDCPVGLRKVKQKLKAARARLFKTIAASFALVSSLFASSAAQAQKQQDEKSKPPVKTTKEPKKNDPGTCKPIPSKGPIVPTMGLVAPAPSEAIINTEKSYKEQVAALVAPTIKGKKLTEGTITFHVNDGEIDQVNMSQSTGDKELDAQLIAVVKGKRLTMPKEGEPTFRWVSVCLSDGTARPKPKE